MLPTYKANSTPSTQLQNENTTPNYIAGILEEVTNVKSTQTFGIMACSLKPTTLKPVYARPKFWMPALAGGQCTPTAVCRR